MPSGLESYKLLSSWKDIAAYLGCDIRTSRRWEKTLGLPIHRLEGSPRSRVFAYKEELDAWIKKRNELAFKQARKSSRPVFVQLKSVWKPGAIVLAAAALLYFFFKGANASSPVKIEIQGSELVLFNKKGDELWRKQTGLSNLQTNAFYQERFQRKAPAEPDRILRLPVCLIRDINSDGDLEILFSIQTIDQTSPILICYSCEGKELWRFHGGRERKFGSTIYYGDYFIKGFDAHDFDGDGQVEVFVLSFQRPDWPTQLVLLNSQGKKLGEYWNVGQLNDYLVTDLNGDGGEELILVGLNNEYKKGCLIAFDPWKISGGSPQTKNEFIDPELTPGSELFYVLFPRTDADDVQPAMDYESIARIRKVNNDVLRLETYASVIYFYLNLRLECQSVSFSHQFRKLHAEAKQRGLISSSVNEEYMKRLIKGLLYFNGRSWTVEVTPCLTYNSAQNME